MGRQIKSHPEGREAETEVDIHGTAEDSRAMAALGTADRDDDQLLDSVVAEEQDAWALGSAGRDGTKTKQGAPTVKGIAPSSSSDLGDEADSEDESHVKAGATDVSEPPPSFKKRAAPKTKAGNAEARPPVTPKKRSGAAKANDEQQTPVMLGSGKARSSAKARDDTQDNSPAAAGREPKTPTPKKRGSATLDGGQAANGEAGSPPSAKKRRAPDTPAAKGRKLPGSYEEAGPEDKMLWDERQAGTAWSAVREQWAAITGEAVASSTLPNRIERLRANFTRLRAQDEGKLVAAVKDVEARFEFEKWGRVADVLEAEHGLGKLPPKSLEKTYKEVVKRGVAPVSEALSVKGVVDGEEG
ncbi:MAG: hypothetical protein M1832_004048 [Thelocarpon impressellum]|nr:MAG: hypothetical protein M1832_004048 [Thelocarpon impressellum]